MSNLTTLQIIFIRFPSLKKQEHCNNHCIHSSVCQHFVVTIYSNSSESQPRGSIHRWRIKKGRCLLNLGPMVKGQGHSDMLQQGPCLTCQYLDFYKFLLQVLVIHMFNLKVYIYSGNAGTNKCNKPWHTATYTQGRQIGKCIHSILIHEEN